MKARGPMSESDQNEVVAQAVMFLAGVGVWRAFIAKMERAGYSEQEVDAAIEAFGKRIGIDL